MSDSFFPPSTNVPVRLPIPCAYLVSYDLKTGLVSSHAQLITELQSSLNWFHYLTNTWIVLRHETLIDFHKLLLTKIHAEDRLLILPAKGPATGWLPSEAWDWLNKNLRNEW